MSIAAPLPGFLPRSVIAPAMGTRFSPSGGGRVEVALTAPYGAFQEYSADVVMPYGLAPVYQAAAPLVISWSEVLQASLAAPWSAARRLSAFCDAPYGAPVVLQLEGIFGWTDRAAVSCDLVALWSSGRDLAAAELLARWGESTPAWRSLDAEPVLLFQGLQFEVLEASLSADEGSPYWLAEIRLAHRADYDQLEFGADVTLRLAGEEYALVVDNRSLALGESEDGMSISARSPLCRMDSPFARPGNYVNEAPIDARALVGELLGPVDWQLPIWTIPAGRVAFDRATPMAVATAIVGAVGGLLESAPDGGVICRPRHWVRPCSDGFDLSMTPAQTFSVHEAFAGLEVFDSITVSDGQDLVSDVAGSDVLEFVPDADDPLRGTVRAWPAPWRPVTLVHTSRDVEIGPRAEAWEQQDETLEVIAGEAQARYPVDRVISQEWRYADLGLVQASGRQISAAGGGYSLIRLVYETRYFSWPVARSSAGDVQFLLMEEAP